MNQIILPPARNIFTCSVPRGNGTGPTRDQLKFFARNSAAGNRSLLTELLDYAAEAEQTITDQKKRIAELESLAICDELTGLLNRRGFDMELAHTHAAARRYDETSLLVYIDLDDFKTVNDSFGHGAGDALLRHVARHLESAIRQTDYAARLGGDEFALILTRTSRGECSRRLFQMQQDLKNSPCRHQGQDLYASASFGIAEIRADHSLAAVMNRADLDMYRQKKSRPKKSRPNKARRPA